MGAGASLLASRDQDQKVTVPLFEPEPDVVMELAQQYAGIDAGLAAVLLVPDVVHVAHRRGAAAAGPGARAVAE